MTPLRWDYVVSNWKREKGSVSNIDSPISEGNKDDEGEDVPAGMLPHAQLQPTVPQPDSFRCPPFPSQLLTSSRYGRSRSIKDLPAPVVVRGQKAKTKTGELTPRLDPKAAAAAGASRQGENAATNQNGAGPMDTSGPEPKPSTRLPSLLASTNTEVDTFLVNSLFLRKLPIPLRYTRSCLVGVATKLYASGDYHSASHLLQYMERTGMLSDKDTRISEWSLQTRCVELNLAVHYILSKYYPEARTYLRAFCQRLHATKNIASILFAAGVVCLSEGWNDHACVCFSRTCELLPSRHTTWLCLGMASTGARRLDRAETAYRIAAGRLQGCVHAWLYAGIDCALSQGACHEKADVFMARAKAMAPDDPMILAENGVLALQKDDPCRAESGFMMAMTKMSEVANRSRAMTNFGFAVMRKRRQHQACDAFEKARLLNPTNYEAVGGLAYSRHLLGQHEEALMDFSKIQCMYNDSPHFIAVVQEAIENANRLSFRRPDVRQGQQEDVRMHSQASGNL